MGALLQFLKLGPKITGEDAGTVPASSPAILGPNFENWSNAPILNGLEGEESLEKFPKRISLLQPHSLTKPFKPPVGADMRYM